MSTDLYPYARVGVDFAPTDTWDPSIAYGAVGYDARQEDWVGALYPYVDEVDGRRVLLGVKNVSGSAIPANTLVAIEDGSLNGGYVAIAPGALSTAAARCRGVTIGAIPAGFCGFVVAEGLVTVIADGPGVTANQAVAPGTTVDGTVRVATIGTHSELGFSPNTIASAATGKVFVRLAW